MEELTQQQRNIAAGNAASEAEYRKGMLNKEEWEPQAPIIDPATNQPKIDPVTGSPLWQYRDKRSQKTMQAPYQPVPAKETGDPNARLTADINSQFAHLMQERIEMDKNPEARPKGYQRPTNQQLWDEAQDRVRRAYGMGKPIIAPSATDPLGLGPPPGS